MKPRVKTTRDKRQESVLFLLGHTSVFHLLLMTNLYFLHRSLWQIQMVVRKERLQGGCGSYDGSVPFGSIIIKELLQTENAFSSISL